MDTSSLASCTLEEGGAEGPPGGSAPEPAPPTPPGPTPVGPEGLPPGPEGQAETGHPGEDR